MDHPVTKRPRLRGASPDDLRSSCKSPGDKVKALKHVGEGNMSEFTSSGGADLIGEWLSQAVQGQETGLILACLGLLEKLPINVDILQTSMIGKLVNENMKQCASQVAVERARKLINTWKSMVNGGGPVVVAKKPAPPPPPIAPVPEAPKPSKPEETPPDAISLESDNEDDAAVAALSKLLDSLPDLDALMADIPAEASNGGKKRIAWRPDSSLVQMVEFAITGTCEELRRTIHETHGGRQSGLHPHGTDSDEQMRRFHESRRKERAMGGKGLHKFDVSEDQDDDIEPTTRFYIPVRVTVSNAEAVRSVKKLKSYERQDLADLHGQRPETIYPNDDDVPDDASEPSGTSKFFAAINTTTATIEVVPSGIREVLDAEAAAATAQRLAEEAPQRVSNFEDEFVKLDSKIQSVILESEDLMRVFTMEPMLMRDITLDKIQQVQSHASTVSTGAKTPMRPPSMHEDKRSWGVSTIRSNVRNQVMNSFHNPPHNFSQQPFMHAPPPQGPPFPPHGMPPPGMMPHGMPPHPGLYGRPPPADFRTGGPPPKAAPYPPHFHGGPPPAYPPRGPPRR